MDKKNYKTLVDKAQKSFHKKEYLQAFLIQACTVEGVVKHLASVKLSSLYSKNPVLLKKYENFGFARLVDELLITGKITKELYENLIFYWKKRNNVIHNILKHKEEKLNEELKEAYSSGVAMKGLIVDDLLKSQKIKTSDELVAIQESFFAELLPEIEKNLSVFSASLDKDFEIILSKLKSKKIKR